MNHHPLPPIKRRSFLKILAAGSLTAPFFTPNLFSAAPSNRVLHASMGGNGMARADLDQLTSHPAVELVAVAEVDDSRVGDLKEKFPKVRIYRDWRELLDRERELTSVNVSTPDHMHAAMGMAALQRGLHVYGQKPLTHDLHESRRLTEVAREKGLVTQMGIQIHSSREYRTGVRLIQSGAIGKVKEIHTWSSKKWGDMDPKPSRRDPVPAGFDWNLWLGVCEERPFIGDGWYHPGNWRRRLDFGTGTFGDMGCHIFDPVCKAMALTAPLSVRSEGAAPNSHSWATDAVIHYVFPRTPYSESDTLPITWYDGDQRPPAEIQSLVGGELPDQGSIFVGTKGVMTQPHVGLPKLHPADRFGSFEMPEMEGENHWHQFINAIQGRGKASANFDYSGPLTESILLGGVATRFPKTTLQWDAKNLQFTNESGANQFVKRPYREGWQVAGL